MDAFSGEIWRSHGSVWAHLGNCDHKKDLSPEEISSGAKAAFAENYENSTIIIFGLVLKKNNRF